MKSHHTSVEDYIKSLPLERISTVSKLRLSIKKNLPKGFMETISYGMIGYVVPHSLYPPGYHCDSKLPLPFINLASQKNYISFYHLGLYEGELLSWFIGEWKNSTKMKLDMGKCCVRFKKFDNVPFELIGILCGKISPKQWISLYEESLIKKR